MRDETFFIVLSALSAFGALALVAHLLQPGLKIASLGQLLRYLTFFAYAATIAWAGVELLHKHLERDPRHELYLGCTVLLIITTAVSIYETHKGRKSK